MASQAIEPILQVKDLRVEFATRSGPLAPVRDISFSLMPGEVLGVVGESGAGKSMAGAALIGLLEPPGHIAGGSVHLAGQRIDNLPDADMRQIRGKDIGTVFQDPLTALNPLFTVGEQIIETIRTHLDVTHREARDRAIALLNEVGIPAPERRIDQYPFQFSGGMRQRIVIALALCAEPRVIIADEPTTALDVSIQAQIIAVLKRLCRERGTSVIIITHDMGVVASISDRVAVMYAGRIVEIGATADIIGAPQHPYTIGLIKSIPSIREKRHRLLQIDGVMPRLTEISTGCPFHPRCPQAFERCRSELPSLDASENGRAACWLPATPPHTQDELE